MGKSIEMRRIKPEAVFWFIVGESVQWLELRIRRGCFTVAPAECDPRTQRDPRSNSGCSSCNTLPLVVREMDLPVQAPACL